MRSLFSSSRFRSRSVESSDPVFRCFETNCASLSATAGHLRSSSCAQMHCSSPATRSARSLDFHLGIVPVGLPWSFHRFSVVLCPVSSMNDNEALRYCTLDACYVIITDGTGYERLEQVEGSHCLRMCGDLEGRYDDCVRQKCCSAVPQQMSRKRRVNDDLSQCIQSYCSAYSVFRERILCIVKNCNRSVLTS